MDFNYLYTPIKSLYTDPKPLLPITLSLHSKTSKALGYACLALSFSLTTLQTATAETNIPPQQQEEVIIVQGSSEQAIRSSNTAISIKTKDAIERIQATQVEHISLQIPNVNFSQGSSRARYFQIRGIGEKSEFSANLNTPVAVQFDNLDLSTIGIIPSLFDAQKIEILKGPQFTQQGSNAIGGIINVVPAKPKAIPEYKILYEAASYDHERLGFVSTGSLSDEHTINYRLSVQHEKNDGYITNEYLNRKDTNNIDESLFRLQVDWTPSPSTYINTTLQHIDHDNGYDAFSLDNNYKTQSDAPGQDAQETWISTTTIRHELYNYLAIKHLLMYTESDQWYGYDADWINLDYHQYADEETDLYTRSRKALSYELNLQSLQPLNLTVHKDIPFQWVAGFFWLDESREQTRDFSFQFPALGYDLYESSHFSNYSTQRLALYADSKFQLEEKTHISLGGRWELVDTQFEGYEIEATPPEAADINENDNSDSFLSYKIAIDHLLNDQLSTYANMSHGYKFGGRNDNHLLAEDAQQYEDESARSFEAGAHWQITQALFTNLNLFHIQRKNIQYSSFSDLSASGEHYHYASYIANAYEGTNTGAEIEIHYLNPLFAVNASLGYLDTSITPVEGADARDQAHAPNLQYHLDISVFATSNITLNSSISGKDSFYFSDYTSSTEKSEPYMLWNLTATLAFHSTIDIGMG